MAEGIPIRPKRAQAAPAPVPLRAYVTPQPPKHLSREARALWRSIVSEWVLGADSLPLLRGALESWDFYQSCRAEVARDGATFKTESGQIRQHPAAKMGHDAFGAFRMAMRQLGLQPEER